MLQQYLYVRYLYEPAQVIDQNQNFFLQVFVLRKQTQNHNPNQKKSLDQLFHPTFAASILRDKTAMLHK